MFGFGILILMFGLHIFDDFVLQPQCLNKLKSKEWWERQEGYCDLYKNDYMQGLWTHGLSWSIAIHLPIVLFLMIIYPSSHLAYIVWGAIIVAQAIIHAKIDDLKCNKKKISLVADQSYHSWQIIASWAVWLIWWLH